MIAASTKAIYQIKAVIKHISPMIWRRFLIPGDMTLAQLHYMLQIAFDWSDEFLHRFTIHAKDYGIYRPGCLWFSGDAHEVMLSDLGLRVRERFSYEYNFFDNWKVQLRVEDISEPTPGESYPQCTAGKRCGPIEDCGGPIAFQKLRAEFSGFYIACEIAQMLASGEVNKSKSELRWLRYWLFFEKLDLAKLNDRLQRSPLDEDPVFREQIIYID